MNEAIRVLLIEDEEIWAEVISGTLVDFGYNITGIANNFESALPLLAAADYDIVILDINLNGRSSGIEIGKLLSGIYQKPFIFITASFDKHTIADAAAAQPSAYLPKPVHPGSLLVAIQNAINNYQERAAPQPGIVQDDPFFIFVKQGAKYRKIEWQNVVYLRSEKNYTCLFNAADKTEYFIRSTLPTTMAEVIPSTLRAQFIQINRAEVVQISFVTEITGDSLVTPYKSMAVSETQLKIIRQRLKLTS